MSPPRQPGAAAPLATATVQPPTPQPEPVLEPARYVAIIADGNRRWARRAGVSTRLGHAAAADALERCVTDALELGIRELTVFVFSTENWARPALEVRELMDLFTGRIALEAPKLHAQGVRVRFLGRSDGVSARLREQVELMQALTAANRRLSLFLAFNYGGRAEIVDAARRFGGGGEQEFARCLYDPEMHDPEVIIRTGGERRISNFLLWQSAYSELVFSDSLWPDFDRGQLAACLREFSERRRRFGGR
jgi:undecaprenyl diphosphate synthase